ncbi:MAG: HigA family addiction module antidote protein [Gemmatimonadaceae bacterium]|nr:HigA family addiction module antidote protein [Gemmatimonadaceae bacterium]MCW5826156.1 HigA family addiction module antidote protein [Gemmatimonadaceae bacterium]
MEQFSASTHLREVLAERGISQASLAAAMGVSRLTVSEIVNARRPITPDTAVRLEVVLKHPSAEFWLRLQADCDLARVRDRLRGKKALPPSEHSRGPR